MTGTDLIFQLFALLLGLSIAELLAGLARAWRISSGATRTGQKVRIGWLVPLILRFRVLPPHCRKDQDKRCQA